MRRELLQVSVWELSTDPSTVAFFPATMIVQGWTADARAKTIVSRQTTLLGFIMFLLSSERIHSLGLRPRRSREKSGWFY